MAKWDNAPKRGGFMAGEVPHGLNEPAYVEMYKGCVVCSYKDTQEALRLVMFSSGGNVRHGTKEAFQVGTRASLEGMYNLEIVREI